MLRGVFIFLVFACKPSVLEKVEKKFPRLGLILNCSALCCWWKTRVPKQQSQGTTFYTAQPTAMTPLSTGGSPKFNFGNDTRYMVLTKNV